MSLLENQSYSKRLKFVKNDDDEKVISFNIGLSCNHEVDKNILLEIENTINKLILSNYKNWDEHQKELLFERELEKAEKERLKVEKENKKLQNKIMLEQEKQKKLQEKHEQELKKQKEKNNIDKQQKVKQPNIRMLGIN